MDTGRPLLSRRGWLIVVGIFFGVLALVEASRMLSPFSGDWELARKVQNGTDLELGPRFKSQGMEVDGNYAKVLWYSGCGTCGNSVLAEGFMVRTGDRIDLYKRIRMTPELEKTPSGFITVLQNGHLSFESADENGKLLLEFRRAPSTLSLAGLFGG